MKYLKLVFSFSLLFLFQHIPAQNKKTDSLLLLLKTAKKDTNQIKVLNGLAAEFRNNNPDTAIYYAVRSIKLSESLSFRKGTSEALLYLGIAKTNLGKYDEALNDLSLSLQYAEELDDKLFVAKIHTNIGNVYSEQGSYSEALKSYFTSLKIREAFPGGDKKGVAGAYNNIGVVYRLMGNYPEALKNYQTSLKMKKELDDQKGLADLYINIGNLFSLQKNYNEALKNYHAALKILETRGDNRGIAACYNNIGSIYSDQGNYPAALTYFNSYLAIKESTNDKPGMASGYLNIGNVYNKQGKYEEAETYFIKAKQLAEQVGYVEYLKEIYLSMSARDSAVGDFKSSLQHYRLFISCRDSLTNKENTKKAVQAQMQYEFDKKESAAKVIADADKRRKNIILVFVLCGLLLVVAFTVFLFNRFRVIQKQKIVIEEQKNIVEKKQKEILDSIHYAKRIQNSLMPTDKYIHKNISRLKNDAREC